MRPFVPHAARASCYWMIYTGMPSRTELSRTIERIANLSTSVSRKLCCVSTFAAPLGHLLFVSSVLGGTKP